MLFNRRNDKILCSHFASIEIATIIIAKNHKLPMLSARKHFVNELFADRIFFLSRSILFEKFMEIKINSSARFV